MTKKARRLYFQVYADSRFVPDAGATCQDRSDRIETALAKLPGVTVERGKAHRITWTDVPDGPGEQWRAQFIVSKTRATTWNQCYAAVNTVNSCFYKLA